MYDLTKIGILHILSSMGVHIPKDTKLGGELRTRLADALNAAQNRGQLPITSCLDPEAAQKWPVRLHPPERESVKWAVWRGSEEERNIMLWCPYSFRWWEDPFWGFRQTMTVLGHTIDVGCPWVMIYEPLSEGHAITMRLLYTLQVDVGTPGIVVAYEALDPTDKPHTTIIHSFRRGQQTMRIWASLHEMQLMLHLLTMNKRFLPPGYRAPVNVFGWRQEVSVLLPIGPLGFRDLDRLGNDPGCVNCGNERRARCSQCQSVSYCSMLCQKMDWPAHKATCLSLKGGKWHTVPFRLHPPGEGGLANARSGHASVNHRRPCTKSDRTWPWEDDSLPPPNIHGAATFSVKFQAPLVAWTHPAFLIYDEHRSFGEVFFYAEDSPSTYAAFIEEVWGSGGVSTGGNMYRLARRSGEREFTVCLDRELKTEVKW